ncbi:hypothetical protein ACFL1I_03750 [Candidatus Omnitrophota bacterium]
MRDYFHNLPEAAPSSEGIIRTIQQVAMDNNISEAKQWPLADLGDFLTQINNYLKQHNLFFHLTPAPDSKNMGYLLANIAKIDKRTVYVPLPWAQEVSFHELRFKNSYLNSHFTRDSFSLRVPAASYPELEMLAHNLDAYYDQALNLFFNIFYFLELKGLDISKKNFLTDADILSIAEGRDLPRRAILYEKIAYKSWRNIYLIATARSSDQQEQVERFARAYADIRILSVNSQLATQDEFAAMAGELIATPHFLKSLASSFDYFFINQVPVSEARRDAFSKLFTYVADCYQEALGDKYKKSSAPGQTPDLLMRLEGIDQCAEKEFAIIRYKIKQRFITEDLKG